MSTLKTLNKIFASDESDEIGKLKEEIDHLREMVRIGVEHYPEWAYYLEYVEENEGE